MASSSSWQSVGIHIYTARPHHKSPSNAKSSCPPTSSCSASLRRCPRRSLGRPLNKRSIRRHRHIRHRAPRLVILLRQSKLLPQLCSLATLLTRSPSSRLNDCKLGAYTSEYVRRIRLEGIHYKTHSYSTRKENWQNSH
jgi:hypothetical protein